MSQREKDEARLSARCTLESALKSYYSACQEADYGFEDDLHDLIYDATDGVVDMM